MGLLSFDWGAMITSAFQEIHQADVEIGGNKEDEEGSNSFPEENQTPHDRTPKP